MPLRIPNSTAFLATSLVASLLIAGATPSVLADDKAPPPPTAPKPENPKPESPKPDPKPDAPKPDPKPDAPKPDAPKPEAPKPDAPKPTSPKPDAPKPDAPKDPKAEPKKDDVKIMTDYWPGTNKVKYRYEMRRGADGKFARNGAAQAYYDHGVLEREGNYKDNKRVGVWKYYDDKGKLLKVEDRGNGTAPDPHG